MNCKNLGGNSEIWLFLHSDILLFLYSEILLFLHSDILLFVESQLLFTKSFRTPSSESLPTGSSSATEYVLTKSISDNIQGNVTVIYLLLQYVHVYLSNSLLLVRIQYPVVSFFVFGTFLKQCNSHPENCQWIK